jgi:cytochrome c oxidase subunit 2
MLNWLPESAASFGPDIDGLFAVIYYVTTAALLLVFLFLAVFLIRYRRRPGHKAVYLEGHAGLEWLWTGGTFLTLVVLVLLSRPVWVAVKGRTMPDDPSAVTIRVIGKQFNWGMVYPGPDGRFDTPDDIRMENELHVPVDTDVWLVLLSEDVIHSFFVPQFRLKQDMVPGREIPVWFRATRTGTYEIACAELCGFGHTTMRGWVHVLSSGDYAAWRKRQWPDAPEQEAAP